MILNEKAMGQCVFIGRRSEVGLHIFVGTNLLTEALLEGGKTVERTDAVENKFTKGQSKWSRNLNGW